MSEREPLRPLSDSQKEALEEATTSYQEALGQRGKGDVAVAHLKARGLGREEVATARLGVVADPFPGHERFRGMLAIPYLSHAGYPLTIRFRCLLEHDHREFFHGKYNSIKDDPPRVYGIQDIHEATDEIDVAEGELDRLILKKCGLHAVAIPGAHIWQSHMRLMLAGFNRIRVWGDPDDAGAELVNTVTRSLVQAKGVRLSDGDVTDTYLKHGKAEILRLAGKEEA